MAEHMARSCGEDMCCPVFTPSRFAACIYAQPLGYLPRHLLDFFRRLLPRGEETARCRTPRKLSPPGDVLPPTAAPKMEGGESKHFPATAPLSEAILPPDHGPSGRPRKPPRTTEAPRTTSAPTEASYDAVYEEGIQE